MKKHPYTIEDINKIANDKNGKCLSLKYINYTTKLEFECYNNHKWLATPGAIINGSWCPQCVLKKYDISNFQKIAEEKGGKCLSSEYVNCRQ